MDATRLASILSRFSDLTILVVGDYFLDQYLIVEAALGEISLETGLEAHQVVEVRNSPGAAGTVTSNLRAMGANVIAVGVRGTDGRGHDLERVLQAMGVDTTAFIVRSDRFTPTYTKPMSRGRDGALREMSRLDIKNRSRLPDQVEDEIIAALRHLVPRIQGVIVADQVQEPNCGVITDRVRDEIARLACAFPDTVFAADSRERIGLYRDVVIKPNAREATRAVYPDRETELDRPGLEALGSELARRLGKPVFLTLGSGGILVLDGSSATHIPACPIDGPIDIVGAGDACMAGLVAALCSGASLCEAAQIGNLSAAVTIRQIGTTGTASREQIMNQFAHQV